jgi:hypothetical protein
MRSVAVAASRIETARAAADRFGVPHAHGDWQEMLAGERGLRFLERSLCLADARFGDKQRSTTALGLLRELADWNELVAFELDEPKDVLLEELQSTNRNVFKLHGGDIDGIGKTGQFIEIIKGGSEDQIGRGVGRPVRRYVVDSHFIAQALGSHGRHLAKLTAPQDADCCPG